MGSVQVVEACFSLASSAASKLYEALGSVGGNREADELSGRNKHLLFEAGNDGGIVVIPATRFEFNLLQYWKIERPKGRESQL